MAADPFSLGEALASDVASLAEQTRRSSARFTPDIARYLFERAWRPLHDAHAGADDMLRSLWRLQLESVSIGQFGVSTDDWRRSAAYPDRFFVRLWIDVLPPLAAACSPDIVLARAVALFNLGERLTARSRAVANTVIDQLCADPTALATEAGLEKAARAALRGAGVLGAPAAEAFDVEALGFVDVTSFDPAFLVDAVVAESNGVFRLFDAGSRRALRIAVSAAGIEPLGIAPDDDGAEAVLTARSGDFEATIDAGLLTIAHDGAEVAYPHTARVPIAVAIDARGHVALVDALSQRVAVLRVSR